ncbi:MAG: SpoIIE family protein phosphatase [Desulfuromonadales bacterium]
MEKEKSTILVVDDDAFVAEMLAEILDSDGYQVETAEHGRDALAKLEGLPETCLVISDMNMPEMNGLELIEAIRKRGSEVPIIILTGNSEISVAISALDKGANDYLLKDENINETIIISVKKVLEKQQLKLHNIQLMDNLARKNRAMEKEQMLASKVQANILPIKLHLPGFQTGIYYRPSNQIGGDFFDALETHKCIHFLIGDISGHSTSSALVMAVCNGMFRSLGQTMDSPLEIVTAANHMLCQMLMDSGMFLTLAYMTLDREKNVLSVVSAGHNPLYLFNGTHIETIESTGPVLGWDPDDTWEVPEFQFHQGSTLFLYTDGLVEAKNSANEEFEARLIDSLTRIDAPPDDLVNSLLTEVTEFCGGVFDDDLTMFAIKRL